VVLRLGDVNWQQKWTWCNMNANDEKEYDNDPVFDLEQSLYEYALVSAEFENDP
ncbi:40804_t:CDS:2, partial [Gigaspora margarita]